MQIHYLRRDEINTLKWDNCIARSVNGIAYAYSWYLDIVAEEWDALIGDDYQAVFPLIPSKKYGFDYLYQPIFARQLGLFSRGALNNELISLFIKAIPNQFRYIDITLNTYLKADIPGAKSTQKITHHLDLVEPYTIISKRYTQEVKNSISLALANGVSVVKGLSAFQILELKKQGKTNMRKKHLETLTKIISTSVEKGAGELFGAYSKHNELCSAVFIITTNSKAIYMLSATNSEGQRVYASYALVDYYIHQNSEKQLVLDFEETNDIELERFYRGFGAQPCFYNHLVINKLPWYAYIFKVPLL